jgi:hypothetical protein
MIFHRRKMQQHHETGCAFNQRANRRAIKANDQIAFNCSGKTRFYRSSAQSTGKLIPKK